MKVKELLSRPGAWHKGSYARDHAGRDVTGDDGSACSFCLAGAIYRCYPKDSTEAIRKVENVLLERVGHPGVVLFNDGPNTTYDDIVAVVNEADI